MSQETYYQGPVHPGEILLEDFLKPMGINQNQLAKRMAVPANRVSQIIRGLRGITADTALRLSVVFGTSAELWMGLQDDYDLEVAREQISKVLEEISPFGVLDQ